MDFSKKTDFNTLTTSAGTRFEIPKFQREYCWEQEQWDSFWEDITKKEIGNFFIGAIILLPAEKGYEIVDGQQRMTTISIFLIALRNISSNIESLIGISNSIHNDFLYPNDKSGKPYYKIKLNQNNSYFEKLITDEDRKGDIKDWVSNPSNKKVKKAYEFFTKEINSFIKEDPENKILELRSKIEGVLFSAIDAPSRETAIEYFDIFNDRGVGLSHHSLYKNFFLSKYNISDVELDDFANEWSDLQDSIEEKGYDFSDFLYYFLLSKTKYFPKRQLLDSMKEYFPTKKYSARQVLDELVLNSNFYLSIFDNGYLKNLFPHSYKELESEVNRFSYTNNKQAISLVISLLRSAKSKTITIGKIRKALTYINNFIVIYSNITKGKSKFYRTFPIIAAKVSQAKNTNEFKACFQELHETISSDIPLIDTFKSRFYNYLMYSNKTTKYASARNILKQVLCAYSLKIYGTTKPPVDFDSMSIEHLIPDNEVKGHHSHSIGNLILVVSELNEKLGTKDFTQKKQILLSEGDFNLNDSILSSTGDLDEEKIKERSDKIAESVLNELWKIDVSTI